jgi:hypothetical protein
MDSIAENEIVGFKLAGGEDAEAIADVVRARYSDALIEVFPAYISVERVGRVEIDTRDVADLLGRPYGVSEFMVTLSSYHGRIEVTDDSIALTSEIGAPATETN